ncbi:MAG: hypothetical protein AAGE99_04250 [Chlamydiota bacterium]
MSKKKEFFTQEKIKKIERHNTHKRNEQLRKTYHFIKMAVLFVTLICMLHFFLPSKLLKDWEAWVNWETVKLVAINGVTSILTYTLTQLTNRQERGE